MCCGSHDALQVSNTVTNVHHEQCTDDVKIQYMYKYNKSHSHSGVGN